MARSDFFSATIVRTEDARACVVLRPGMVFRPKLSLDGQPVNDQIFIVVANLKWGLLVWPEKASGWHIAVCSSRWAGVVFHNSV